MCDIVYKEDGLLRGDVFSIRVLSEYLKDIFALKVAVIGTEPYAKAFSFLSCGFEVSYFHDNLEELMAFMQELDIQNADVNRIAPDMEVDLSGYDAVLDFSDFASLSMVTELPKYALDMKNSKMFSALRQRSSELESCYVGYDELLEPLSKRAYEAIKAST
jgi:hypothetical protein